MRGGEKGKERLKLNRKYSHISYCCWYETSLNCPSGGMKERTLSA